MFLHRQTAHAESGHPDTNGDRAVPAALSALILLHVVMLASLFAGVAPHPPAHTPLFGMAPFLGAALSALVAALVLGTDQTRAGRAIIAVALLLSLVSFGPHKAFDPAFPLIWPAVVTAWLSILTVAARLLPALRATAPQPS